MIRLIKAADYEEMSRIAARIIAAQITLKPDSVLGLATGSTPIGLYDELVEKYREDRLDFSSVSTVNLDEYRSLSGDHEQSYRYFMNTHLFDKVNIDKTRTHVPDGIAPDAEAECAAYDEMVRALGGIDLQLLGLGHNGHIGFNEPGDAFIKHTHVVDLTERTIEANARLFASAEDVPRQALTMGIGTIMSARQILVAVNGEGKAQALRDVCFGPITPKVQGSVLQLHPCVTVVADEGALSACEMTGSEMLIQ